ncbi:MAG: polyprenyl synthetase family protein [Planctomycetes bacterium]|nr:polyprenyl synthetase family protein [Planctomycetota bacterium]
MTHPELDAWLKRAREFAEHALASEFARVAPTTGSLGDAMRYALFAPGKRLRPSLVLLVCEGLGGDAARAVRPAAAIEMLHTYSLVHDDLPCMDDDALRRGQPTCHVVFGEALALLAGDALLTAAFEVLAGTAPERAAAAGQAAKPEHAASPEQIASSVAVLARAAGAEGMVRGQVLDLSLEPGADVREVLAMHALKTGALIAAACELGALAACVRADERGRVREFGVELGKLFQAVDDVLDVVGAREELGKTPGKDAKLARATLVRAVGLDGARRVAAEAAEGAERAAKGLGWGASHPGVLLVEHLLTRTR